MCYYLIQLICIIRQVPPLEGYANVEQALVNPSPLTDEYIRTALL